MLGLRRHRVRVVPYDPAWPGLAEAECASLRAAAGQVVAEIEHVGSTAVPGLASKPILDLAVAVEDAGVLPDLVERFAGVGYLYRGDGGERGGQLFVRESAPGVRVVHLHVVARSDPQWRSYLAFREALRNDAGLRARYEFLKTRLVSLFPQSRRAYAASKDDFVERALRGGGGTDPADMYDRIAPVYHLVYADWEGSIRRQAKDLSSIFTAALGPGELSVVDVSCGIGTQALGLAALGHRMTASDLSPASVARAREEARRRGLSIAFAVGDMPECHRRHGSGFDAVLSADNSVPHLPDDAAVLAAFRAFLAALRPGGVAAVSVLSHGSEERSGPELHPYGVRRTDAGRATVFQIREYHGDRYDVWMYFVEESGDSWPEVTVGCSRYRAVPPDRYLALLRQAGFVEVRRLDDAYFQPVLLGRRPG